MEQEGQHAKTLDKGAGIIDSAAAGSKFGRSIDSYCGTDVRIRGSCCLNKLRLIPPMKGYRVIKGPFVSMRIGWMKSGNDKISGRDEADGYAEKIA